MEAARAVARALGVERGISSWTIDLRAIGGSSLDVGRCRAARSRPGRRPRFRPPTCRRATRSSCRWRSAGRKSSTRATSSSASTRWTIPAIPTAARSSSRAFERLANLATQAGVEGASFRVHTPLIDAEQGRHHPARARARPRLRPDAQLLRSVAGRRALRHVRQLRAARARASARPASPTRVLCARIARTRLRILAGQPIRRQVRRDHMRAARAVHRWRRHWSASRSRERAPGTSCATQAASVAVTRRRLSQQLPRVGSTRWRPRSRAHPAVIDARPSASAIRCSKRCCAISRCFSIIVVSDRAGDRSTDQVCRRTPSGSHRRRCPTSARSPDQASRKSASS